MNTQNYPCENAMSANDFSATSANTNINSNSDTKRDSSNNTNFTKKMLFNHLFAKNNILCYKSSFTNQIFFHVCEPTPASKLFEIDFKNNNLSKDMIRVDIPDGDYEDIVEKYGNTYITSFYLLYVFKINIATRDLEIVFDRNKFIDSNPMPKLLNGDTVSINKKEYKNLIEVIDSTRDLYSNSVNSTNGSSNDSINISTLNMFSGSLSPLNYTILSNLSEPFLSGVVINDFIYFDNFPRISITQHVKENLIENIFSSRNGSFQKIWSKENSKKNQDLINKEIDMLEFDDSMTINIKKVLDYYGKEFEMEEKISKLNVLTPSGSNQNILKYNNPFTINTSEIPSITGTVVYDGKKLDVKLDDKTDTNKVDNKNDINESTNKIANESTKAVDKIANESANKTAMPTYISRFKKEKYIFNINEKFHIKELLLAYEPYNERMTDKIKFYYGVKLYNNAVFWRNNSFPVFLDSKVDCGIKVVGFTGEFEGKLLTFNEMKEMENNGLTDGSIIILVGCLNDALRLNNCKANTEIVDGEVHYLHIIPRNAESKKLLKLFNNSPLELFGGSRNRIDIV